MRRRGMRHHGPIPFMFAGAIVVALISAVIIEDGWQIWIPTLAAFAVVIWLSRRIGK
jgi:uncharacterized membrane protein YoaK (UPF0700 family)